MITLRLKPLNRGSFFCLPAREIQIESQLVLCNDITFPWEFNPHSIKPYAVSNEYGTLGVVWAAEHEVLDVLVDAGLGNSLLIPESDMISDDDNSDVVRLGNAGEPCNIDHVTIQEVELDELKDCKLLCLLAEARGDQSTTL